MNGRDLTQRSEGKWIIDFGHELSELEAAFYEEPFSYVVKNVRPYRQEGRHKMRALFWWRHVSPSTQVWQNFSGLERYIATPRVAKYRLFTWLDISVCPDSALVAIAREDDVTFGILHSRLHELWSLRLGTSLEDRPRYTLTTTFETFPFPRGLAPNNPASSFADDPRAISIARAARHLVELRNRWLNPPEWVNWIDEPVPGYPQRPVPRDDTASKRLKKRTLTNLYNKRPQWLTDAHALLDEAVAAAYGWSASISEEDALRELLSLNLNYAEQ